MDDAGGHDAAAQLDQIIGTSADDDGQLRALRDAFARELPLPAEATVAGAPVSVLELVYDGNPRRGLLARCRSGPAEVPLAFADLVFPPGSPGAALVALFGAWIEAARTAPGGPASERRASGSATPLEAVVLSVAGKVLQCRELSTQRDLQLLATSGDAVPGEIITFAPGRVRASGPLAGRIRQHRLDVAALRLTPLALADAGEWNPLDHEGFGPEDRVEEWAEPIRARGVRPAYEMERVVPGEDPKDFDSSPLFRARELLEQGRTRPARELLMSLVAQDLRCLDAHAHLGFLEFDGQPRLALRHYDVGLAIGELSLGAGFDGALPWGLIDNRPFLRCLHGKGCTLWRLGRLAEAQAVFHRLLWLNPVDNQGARFNLADLASGRTWEEAQD